MGFSVRLEAKDVKVLCQRVDVVQTQELGLVPDSLGGDAYQLPRFVPCLIWETKPHRCCRGHNGRGKVPRPGGRSLLSPLRRPHTEEGKIQIAQHFFFF